MKIKKRWILDRNLDQQALAGLAHQINVPLPIAVLLFRRGIDTFEKAKRFIRAESEPLHDPFLMKDMDRAVERAVKACREKQKIIVFGDYDVDGTSSTAMLFMFFEFLNPGKIDYYIPDRHKEGYGLSKEGIDHAFKADVELLVAVDCGITAHDEIMYAVQRDIDVIVCDHHLAGEGELPRAHSVLNPKRKDCAYPFKDLCGAGVVLKLIQGISDHLGYGRQAYEQYLDLVALATSADIVGISGENRTMVKRGLEIINNRPRPGIQHLIQNSGLQGRTLGVSEIVFSIGPRINSVGRLGDAKRAVKLLISQNDEVAREYGQVLESENKVRRGINESVYEEALDVATKEVEEFNRKIVVVFGEEWNYGVIGIVASKIVETFHRPAIVITRVNGKAKGSARSISGFDIHAAIHHCEDLLEAFGGHKYAAGLTINPDRIDEFRQRLNEYAEVELHDSLLVPELLIDVEINLPDINARFSRLLKLLAPHGPGNRRPVFLTRGVQLARPPVVHHDKHLQLKIRQGTRVFDSIGFNLAHLKTVTENPDSEAGFDIVYQVAENFWKGRRSLQLRLLDLDRSSNTRLVESELNKQAIAG